MVRFVMNINIMENAEIINSLFWLKFVEYGVKNASYSFVLYKKACFLQNNGLEDITQSTSIDKQL